MLSKNSIKLITSLRKKKYRQKYNKFVAEGDKIVREVLSIKRNKIHSIYATADWITENDELLTPFRSKCHSITERELKGISSLNTPNQVLILLDLPEEIPFEQLEGRSLVLDRIQDPGNLGTMIRIADWFGMDRIICSPDCADHFQHKVVQSSMGAFLRVPIFVKDLHDLLDQFPEIESYGLVLGGNDIFKTKVSETGFIFIGNESQGIQESIQDRLDFKLEIPAQQAGTESLNAAIAAGIACAVISNSK